LNYRLIAVDLDDSLLGSDLKISDANKRTLLTAQEKGVYVTIATGRMLDSAMPFVKELNISIPVITYQGAFIKDTVNAKTLAKTPIPMEYTHRIIDQCKKDNLHAQVYMENDYYFEHDNEYSQLYHRLSGIKGHEVGDFKAFIKEEPIKILIIDQPERIAEAYRQFEELFGSQLQVTISKPNYLELTHIDATKGNALRQLGSMLGVKREEIIAIGDSFNDVTMIEYAGLGVAMGNAPDKVKALARYVTKGNDEDGVAEVVERFILKGEVLSE
jgi:Cof subfamily protein (haloacid dehalogenase superfamily)